MARYVGAYTASNPYPWLHEVYMGTVRYSGATEQGGLRLWHPCRQHDHPCPFRAMVCSKHRDFGQMRTVDDGEKVPGNWTTIGEPTTKKQQKHIVATNKVSAAKVPFYA